MTKVLVVDDQRIAREYMENVVRSSEGYELAGSLTKADLAATVCRRSAVELVLMDVCTHGRKDGIEAAAELKERFPKLKIIIVTSMPEESFIKRAKEVGADSFWHKEVSPEELLTVMDAVMQGRQMWPGETPVVKLGVTTSTDFTETEIKVLRKVCHDKKAAVEIPATGTPTDPPKPADPQSPQTGDNSNMILWIVLLLASGLGVTSTVVYSKRKKYVK